MIQKVQLFISCTGLRDADLFSKSDPLCTVFDLLNNELGRTECITDELNPRFKETIIFDYNPYKDQDLIFKVYDIDDWNNDINKADFLGEMECTLHEVVNAASFAKSLRYEGADCGKIYIKSEVVKSDGKGGNKRKKGKKGGKGRKKTEISNETWIKEEMGDDTFKSTTENLVEDNSEDERENKFSETMCTEAFTPTVSQFSTSQHPLRRHAGTDGYLSDPGIKPGVNNDMTEEQYESLNESKPYHFIPSSRSSLADMSLTPLEDISCITPSPRVATSAGRESSGGSTGTTVKRPPDQVYSNGHNDTFKHLTGEFVYEEDSYDQLQKGQQTSTHMTTATHMTPENKALVNTGTSPISHDTSPVRYTMETQTGEESLMFNGIVQEAPPPPPAYHHTTSNSNYSNNYVNHYPINDNQNSYKTPQQINSPPSIPLSLHNIPKQSPSELKWCQYSSSAESGLWESTEQPDDMDKTEFFSFSNNNENIKHPSSRRPPVLDDFEHVWSNVLNDSASTPQWALVEPQQWRIWFEFYKANSKVSKMRSLLVTTIMGTRDTCVRGRYVNPDKKLVHLPVNLKCDKIIEDKSVLHQTAVCRFANTEINVINTDPVQVCLHLQNSGYKPALFVPANPKLPGGEWRTGGIGPLEEFIRRSSYYTCVDNIDKQVTSNKKQSSTSIIKPVVGSTGGLLLPTECQINTNVSVFRESQQRNYTYLPEPRLIDVCSLTPLPKTKRSKEEESCLSKEEVHLLKRKLGILFNSAGCTLGADCLVVTPHLSEGHRAPHQHIAQIIQAVCNKYNGMFKRVIIAIERDVIFHDFSKQVLDTYNKVFPEGHITLPLLPPLPSSQDIVLWHWVGDNGNWYPYDPRQNEVIDAIYLRGDTKMSMKGADSAHPGYVVDFNHFTVKSLSSHASRKIGRFKLVYDKIVKNKKSASRPVGNWVSAVEETEKLYKTAGDETLQLKLPVAVWQWLNDDNLWSDYTTEQSNKLESAYLQHGTACVILKMEDMKFSVNTKSRIQTNTSTGKQRKVKRVTRDDTSPRATSTPTPPTIKPRTSLTAPNLQAVWEHQGSDKSWLPFDNTTSDLIEQVRGQGKDKVTVVFNNQAYWIYLQPYNLLVDPKTMEEYEIRRTLVNNGPQTDIKPTQLFKAPTDTSHHGGSKVPVTPMSNSTMIDETNTRENSALYRTANDFASVLQSIENKPKFPSKETHDIKQRIPSTESAKYDASKHKMVKTFMRHPSILSNIPKSHSFPHITQTTSNTSISSTNTSVSILSRDPTREFSWEWQDTRTGLWHSLQEFISCFLEPASKTQGHGGVRTSKLTQGQQQIMVRADFNEHLIMGHLPGRPNVASPLRRVEVCKQFS